MEIQWSLVIFTALSGTAGWLLAAVAYAEFAGGLKKSVFPATLTALVLLIVGGLGLIALGLLLAGVLPLKLQGSNRFMIGGIMGAMFVIFIVMGFVSLKNSKQYAREADSENSLKSTMEKWCRENLEGAKVDASLQLSAAPEEEWYFRRVALIKALLNRQFVNLDQEFLDHFVDDMYDTIFPEG